MAITLHDPHELRAMARAGAVAAATLQAVGQRLRAGVTAADIDEWVRGDTSRRGAVPSQLGFRGFPAAVCVSPNHVVCHGVPSTNVVLREGDIVNVDVTSCLDGFHGDTSRTFALGEPPAAAKRVMRAAAACLQAGIDAVRPGGRLGDVGAAVLAEAHRHGCGVVEDFGGHGIGRRMHMAPHVSHVGRAGRGVRLRPGMTFTIEPMITIGNPRIRILDDGWTAVTEDGSPSAQFEHTVAVTAAGVWVLTEFATRPPS